MLEISKIRQFKDLYAERLKKRGISDATQILDDLLLIDQERRNTQNQRDQLLQESKLKSKEIGQLFQQGKQAEANVLKESIGSLKESTKAAEDKVDALEKSMQSALYAIPNIPHELVPAGISEENNEIINEIAEMPDLPENALPHWELAKKYNLIDFELGVKISGAGFPVYIGKGAKMQRALIAYFLDCSDKAGYTEYMPPLMVNEASGIATGQLPDKEGQMYYMPADDLYLIPTAEVPLTNLFRDVILSEDKLPVKLTGYTPCFRREAGSYGKDVRGLNRLHQFDKVEIVQIAHPEKSYEILEDMRVYVSGIIEALGLPYRTLRLCGGDLGFVAAMTYDFETYSAAQERWLEVSSVSNFETYQSNRLKLRYKNADGKNELLHSLNGSALALPRILATILENNQTADGIKVPDVLVPYCGFDMIS